MKKRNKKAVFSEELKNPSELLTSLDKWLEMEADYLISRSQSETTTICCCCCRSCSCCCRFCCYCSCPFRGLFPSTLCNLYIYISTYLLFRIHSLFFYSLFQIYCNMPLDRSQHIAHEWLSEKSFEIDEIDLTGIDERPRVLNYIYIYILNLRVYLAITV